MPRWVYRALAAPFFVGAFGWWLLSPGPDCDPRQFGGCGIFDIGLVGIFGTFLNWLIVCLIAVPGAFLWTAGDRKADRL